MIFVRRFCMVKYQNQVRFVYFIDRYRSGQYLFTIYIILFNSITKKVKEYFFTYSPPTISLLPTLPYITSLLR